MGVRLSCPLCSFTFSLAPLHKKFSCWKLSYSCSRIVRTHTFFKQCGLTPLRFGCTWKFGWRPNSTRTSLRGQDMACAEASRPHFLRACLGDGRSASQEGSSVRSLDHWPGRRTSSLREFRICFEGRDLLTRNRLSGRRLLGSGARRFWCSRVLSI